MRRNANIIFLSIIALQFMHVSSSCNNAKKVAYFKDIPDSSKIEKVVQVTPFTEPTIQPNDNLLISVETIDQRNVATGSDKQGSQKDAVPGYLVDKEGFIEVPLVGRINLANKTTSQAKEIIRANASKYYVDPIVNVRFLNFYVQVAGDVARPGKIPVLDEKVSILDALGMAGDLNITAKRDNVLLIREENGVKKFIRFNLNSSDIFKSPYYYLHSGDYVYVEPIKAKSRTATSDTSKDRFITLGTTIVSLIVLLYTVTK